MPYSVLNKQDLDVELQEASDQLVVIDFYANWCGPCKIIEPYLEDLSVQYADGVKFLKINIDDCEDIAMMYNVTSMPTFLFIKNNKILDVLVGGNVEKLTKNIEKYFEHGQATKPETVQVEETNFLEDEYTVAKDLNTEMDDLQDPTAVLEVIVDDHI